MAQTPNIVLIVADQLNARYLGAYGDQFGASPVFDSLALAGTTFENAYCQAPLCMPSRASFNTGLYPHACDVRHNPVNLDIRFPTLAERLKAAGYRTGGFGHLGGDGIERGFDEKVDFWDEPIRSSYRDEQRFVLAGGGKPPTYCGAHPFPEHVFDRYATDAALGFLRSNNAPFYLQLSFMRPHIPLVVPEPYASMHDPDAISLPETWQDNLDGKPSNVSATRRALQMEGISERVMREALAVYRGSISFVDALAGELIDECAKGGILDNTLVIVTADHGDYAGEFGLIGKTGQFYDCLSRVPLIIRGDGFAAGERVSSPRALVDIVPTVLDACGITPDTSLHGRPLLRDSGDRTVFAATSGSGDLIGFNHRWPEEDLHPLPTDPYSSGPCSHVMDGVMARSDRWKLVVWTDGSLELYDMIDDRLERTNRAGDPRHGALVQEMLQRIIRWQIETWRPDTPQKPLPYHYRSAWIDAVPESWRERRREWDERHSD